MNNDFFIKNSFSKFIEITGKDRVEFLQGLVTNDINKCKNNDIVYYHSGGLTYEQLSKEIETYL